jgi:hypothetical protein
MAPKIRWGILSTGSIADSFVRGLRVCPDAEAAAVGSRAAAAAEKFGARHGIPRRHGSYEALAADPDIDIIYVGTPRNLHCDNTLGHRNRPLEFPLHGNGYNYEAEEAMRCLRDGRLESADMPLHETLAIMRTLDRIRAPWGLKYPGEI